MPYIGLPGGGDDVIVEENTLRERIGMDVMVQLQDFVLKARQRQWGLAWSLLIFRGRAQRC